MPRGAQRRGALGPARLSAADADRRYATGPALVTDLVLFHHRLAYAAGKRAEDGVVTLRGALELVRGPVFTARGGERSSFVWIDMENWISTWELDVTEAAEDLATRSLDLVTWPEPYGRPVPASLASEGLVLA